MTIGRFSLQIWTRVAPWSHAVFLMLLIVAGGCAPWNSGRRTPKQELRPPEPRSDLYRHQLTHLTAPYGDRSTAQSEGDLPRTNAPGESIPAFQFTSQTPAFKLKSDGNPISPRTPNPPGLLAPRPGEVPTPLNVVRVDPQPADDLSSTALDESIQLVVFELPVPTGSGDLSTEEQHQRPDVPKPGLHSNAVALSNSEQDELAGEDVGASKTICETERCTSQPCPVNIAMRNESPERAAWAALQYCNSFCRWIALHCPNDECQTTAMVAPVPDSEVTGLPSAEQLEQKIGELSTFVAQQVDRSDLTDEQSDYWQVSDQLLQLLRKQMSLLEDEQTASLAPAERNYWRFQVQALVNLLEATNPAQPASVPRHIVAETVDSLRQAMKEMESLANLEIPHAAFCTEVRGFGQYDALPEQVLQTGQPILIYCELQNYLSQRATIAGEEWYVTRLRSKIVIRDPLGRIVQRADFPIVEDLARNQRQDFYLHVPYTVGHLPAGAYRLDLVIDDVQGNKSACYQPGLTFRVR